MPDSDHSLPPGRQPYDVLNGVRVGGLVGALLGGVVAAIVGSAAIWFIAGGAVVGGSLGWAWERRSQRRADRAT